jgi:lysophospholipase L1-like esterase
MVDLARSRGIEVILVAAPQIRALIAPALFYSLIALDTGVSFEPAVVSHIFNDDALTFNRMYPNERGYRVLAEALAARLRKQGAL